MEEGDDLEPPDEYDTLTSSEASPKPGDERQSSDESEGENGFEETPEIFGLYDACENGDITKAQEVLATGKIAVTAPLTSNGVFALFVACQCNHLELAKRLLELGADVNQAKQNGVTCLFIACQQGHLEIVGWLLDNGADVNLARDTGASPLCITCQWGRIDIARLLLSRGADVNQLKTDGATPLFIACQYGKLDVAELLLDSGAEVDANKNDGATPLFIASQKGHRAIVKLLVKRGAAIDHVRLDGTSSLFVASQKGHTSTVALLLRKRADPNLPDERRYLPIFNACRSGYREILRLLLAYGSAVNAVSTSGCTPLLLAAMENPQLVQTLVACGAHHNARALEVKTREGYSISELEPKAERLVQRRIRAGLQQKRKARKWLQKAQRILEEEDDEDDAEILNRALKIYRRVLLVTPSAPARQMVRMIKNSLAGRPVEQPSDTDDEEEDKEQIPPPESDESEDEDSEEESESLVDETAAPPQ